MIWDRWKRAVRPADEPGELKPFEDLIEEAPVMAFLLDERGRVVAANEAARLYFKVDVAALPASLDEVTLESRLADLLRAGTPERETQLAHRRRTIRSKLVPGPRSGETLMFLTDVTHTRHLERVRQEFVANLVHELKTPITALRLSAEGLLDDPPAAERDRFANRLVAEVDLLSGIIDNLRQLAEIESGAVPVHRTTFDLRALIQTVVEREPPDRPVNVDMAPGMEITSDRPKLAQALGNLLDNAAKFSPPGAGIDVVVTSRRGGIAISIRDRGPGVSPEHSARIFERFYKVDRARPRTAGGSGLGLAIAKHLVQALGGTIETRPADGGGQAFTIDLPDAP